MLHGMRSLPHGNQLLHQGAFAKQIAGNGPAIKETDGTAMLLKRNPSKAGQIDAPHLACYCFTLFGKTAI